jgi:hypothetical protein
MSSIPERPLEVWQSSLARSMEPISGAFSFDVIRSGMVSQTLEFLREIGLRWPGNVGGVTRAFLLGAQYSSSENPALFYFKRFETAEELFSFGIQSLSDAIMELELHTDINLTFSRVSYLADVGTGPNLPLLIISRLPYSRGIAFEVDERSEVTSSFVRGDFRLSERARVAQQHYSTGMALLAAEDQINGVIDAAFMQFYLTIESVLRSHTRSRALANGPDLFGAHFSEDLKKISSHVFEARNRFFGHVNTLPVKNSFDVAKQTLVARWLARRLIELEIGRPLVKREMRLYPLPNSSIEFRGNAEQLETDFRLP